MSLKLKRRRENRRTSVIIFQNKKQFLHESFCNLPLVQAVEKNGETLDQLKALNVEQEKDVEHVRQRDELLKKVQIISPLTFTFYVCAPITDDHRYLLADCCHLQVESMKKKLPWLKYDMKKAEYLEVKEKEKEAKKKLDEAANTLNDLKEPIEYDHLV